MIEPTTEQWFYITSTSLFFITAFFYVLFYRITVMRIEREMAKEGFEPPEWDSGIGGRGMMYNQLILFNIKNHPFVDSETVLRLINKKDWWLAFLSFYTFLVSAAIGIIGGYLYIP